jgi:hypothetical protein
VETAPLRRFNYSPLRDGHGDTVDQRLAVYVAILNRPHIRRQHKTERVVQRLFMLACAHSDSHASNSGVFSSRDVQTGSCVSLATGVQWLVIAVGIPRSRRLLTLALTHISQVGRRYVENGGIVETSFMIRDDKMYSSRSRN